MATVRVQTEPFELAAEMADLTARGGAAVGGVGCFIGVVRDDPPSPGAAAKSAASTLVALTLEHYPGMTERAMTAIAEEAERRFQLLACTLLHRVGTLGIGEGIVLVLAAAPHRGNALEATAYLIDWLKTRAPFWKRQDYADGSQRWVEAREADEASAARWDPTS